MIKLHTMAACLMLALAPDLAFAVDSPDEQIAAYLSQIETNLADNDTVSFYDLSEMVVRAGSLLSAATPKGRMMVQVFPARLRLHAQQDQDARPGRAINFKVFADAIGTFLGPSYEALLTTVVVRATPLPPLSTSTLLVRGDTLLGLGDISAARLLYVYVINHAVNDHVGMAAFKLANTFDPAFFAANGVRGMKPDVAEAMKWYRKAAVIVPEADQRLKRLERLAPDQTRQATVAVPFQ